MFKRSTKLTALLVAAASVASTVPAMAATKLATKDGTIEKGVAYKDNKYLYQGYRSDDDDNGLYISTSGKDDKPLDDAKEVVSKFGSKYVAAVDGSDNYVVDLESGKITDEDTIDDLEDTAQTKLQNKLKTADDRFKNGIKIDSENTLTKVTCATDSKDFKDEAKAFTRVTGNKFEDNYYVYKVAGAQNPENAVDGTATDVFGYTNDNGKYIDCSYDLNLYAYATTDAQSDGKMYKIEDVDASVDNGQKVKDDDGNLVTDANGKAITEKISVQGVRFVKYIGQDDKYIYSIVAVTLNNSYSVYTGQKIDNDVEHFYVQKVSKEQGDKHNDAYLPKTTEMYEIAPENATYVDDNKNNKRDAGEDKVDTNPTAMGNGDSATALDALLGNGEYAGVKNDTQYAIVDGNIYVYYENASDKIKIIKIKLATSEKLDRYNNGYKDKNANKISAHIALKTGDQDHKMTDVDEVKGDYGQPWTVDINGTLWFIKEGSIFKCVKMGEWQEVYTCDRSLDSLDVYDENNLIAWDSDGDVYTTIDEGTEEAKKEAGEILGNQEQTTEPAVTAKTGWDQLADGTWNLYDATGKKVTGWANVGGVWYYMDPITAVMKTGWLNDNGTWYYLQASGAMKTGWLNDNGTWYYLKSNGAMATGWLQDTDGQWYYLNDSGAMLANTTVDGYVLGANGAWIR